MTEQPTASAPPIVSVRGLRKSYGGKQILQGLNFDIPPGRIYGLIGHNGAGKTTTLNAVLGLTSAEGSIRVLGQDPFAHRARLMRDVAFISDVASLPRFLRVRELLAMMRGLHPRFFADKAIENLNGTDIKLESKVKQLSKGMVAQLHLALALAIDARLLVLDEPTLGLDIIYRKRFYRRLVEDYMRPDRTLLITTHQVDEIEFLLTDIMFIRDGVLVLHRPKEELNQLFTQVLVEPERIEQGLALRPVFLETRFGQTVMVFENGNRSELDQLGRASTPTISDLFVALMQRETVNPGYRSLMAMLTLLRREYWEHRWALVYIPGLLLLALALACLGLVINADRMMRIIGGIMIPGIAAQVLSGLAAIVWGAYALGAMFFYCADAFAADKRNNAMLFWKSLPQSDLKILGSKFITALLGFPLVALVFLLLSCGIVYVGLLAGNLTAQIPAPPAGIIVQGFFDIAWLAGLVVGLAVLWYVPFMAAVAGLSAVVGRWSIPIVLLAPAITAALEYSLLRTTTVYNLLDQRRNFDFGFPYLWQLIQGQGSFDPQAFASAVLNPIDWPGMGWGWIFSVLVIVLASEWRRRSVLG